MTGKGQGIGEGAIRRVLTAAGKTALLAVLTLIAGISAAWALDNPAARCAVEVARQERSLGIPPQLLHSISIVESGRWDDIQKMTLAWPWTVMAEGRGRILPTKEAAIAEVQGLKAKGVTNIDVGCMQVNLRAHPNAFANLDEAFEPQTNVAYAARFLMGLYSNTKSWPVAASYYHSQTPDLANTYRNKLMAVWSRERERAGGILANLEMQLPPGSVSAQSAGVTFFKVDRSGGGGGLKPLNRTAPPASEKAQLRNAAMLAEREEARRIAAAYRQARMEEYHLRKMMSQPGRSDGAKKPS